MSLSSILTSMETYKQSKIYRLKVLKGDNDTINDVLSTVSLILRNSQVPPIQQFLAVKLAKDIIEVFNDSFISQFQTVCLPQIEKIAQFEYNNPDPNRGRRMFENPQIGNSLLTLVLECIFVWSRWFPIDPSTNQLSCYKVAYEKLVRLRVNFEKVQIYFDYDTIVKHVPETNVPRLMLRECSDLIKSELLQQFNDFKYLIRNKSSASKIIVDKLQVTLKYVTQLDESDQFYQNIWQRLMKKALGRMKTSYVPKQITLSWLGHRKNQKSSSNDVQLRELERQNSDLLLTIRTQQQELDQLKQELFMIKSVKNDGGQSRQQIFKPTQQLLQSRNFQSARSNQVVGVDKVQNFNMNKPMNSQNKIFDDQFNSQRGMNSSNYRPYIPYQERRQLTNSNSNNSNALIL